MGKQYYIDFRLLQNDVWIICVHKPRGSETKLSMNFDEREGEKEKDRETITIIKNHQYNNYYSS